MPAPSVPRARLTLSGNVGPTAWASSVWFSRSSNLIPASTNINDALTAALGFISSTDWPATFVALNATDTNLTQLRYDYYTSGSNASAASGTKAVSGFVGTGNPDSPASTSIVQTLLTALQTKSGRGRMYIPATGAIPSARHHQFSDALISALAQSWAEVLTDINNEAAEGDTGVLTAVVSSSTMGAVHPVTAVRVDSLPDRQEHREKGLVPSRFTALV